MPTDQQLSLLPDPVIALIPYNSPTGLVLRVAQILRRVWRLAPHLCPLEILGLVGDLDLFEERLDQVEAALRCRMASWARFVGSKRRKRLAT